MFRLLNNKYYYFKFLIHVCIWVCISCLVFPRKFVNLYPEFLPAFTPFFVSGLYGWKCHSKPTKECGERIFKEVLGKMESKPHWSLVWSNILKNFTEQLLSINFTHYIFKCIPFQKFLYELISLCCTLSMSVSGIVKCSSHLIHKSSCSQINYLVIILILIFYFFQPCNASYKDICSL